MISIIRGRLLRVQSVLLNFPSPLWDVCMQRHAPPQSVPLSAPRSASLALASSWLYLNYPAYAGTFPCSTSVCLFPSPPLCSCIRMCICVQPCRQSTYGNTSAPLSVILSASLTFFLIHTYIFFLYLRLYVNPLNLCFSHHITTTLISRTAHNNPSFFSATFVFF